MKLNRTIAALSGGMLLLLTGVAEAHPGHPGHGSFSGGFAHPFSGIDHILAMVAVGILAARMGGRALWALPLTFISLMAGGGLLNLGGASVPGVEQGIAASVLVLGLMLASPAKMPLRVSAALVALFAIFHGYAHVAEMRAGSTAGQYAIGFIAATALLHGAGIGIGTMCRKPAMGLWIRAAGAAMACCGLLLLMGAISA
jgi:urease accessory protein